MRVKPLVDDDFRILAVMNGEGCPSEEFIFEGEKSTEAARMGLLKMLEFVGANGLQAAPSAWFHEANKELGIFEFTKGPLRLFFFKGEGNHIAICTTGVRKQGQKADKQAVAKAAAFRDAYFAAVQNNTLEVVNNEN